MQRNPTPQAWMRRIHHASSKCTGILPLTHECTKIINPQEHALKSYSSHMNAPKSWSLRQIHLNRHFSGKCNWILTLTHECTEIIIPQVNAPSTYPSLWMHRNNHPSSKCTEILPLTQERTEIVTPQVNAPESYPSHMNAPKSSLLR